jgi:hypothetical protein
MKGDKGESILTLFFLAFFVILILTSMTYSPKARRMPLVVTVPGLVLCGGWLATKAIKKRRAPKQREDGPAEKDEGKTLSTEPSAENKKMLVMFGWMVFLVGMIWVVGFLITIPVYTILFMRSMKESWRSSLLFAAFGFASLYFLFIVGLHMELYPGLIFR